MKKDKIDRIVIFTKKLQLPVLLLPVLSSHLFLTATVVNTFFICRWADLGTEETILGHWSHS